MDRGVEAAGELSSLDDLAVVLDGDDGRLVVVPSVLRDVACCNVDLACPLSRRS
ncbi:MAG: hypothetical protein ACKOD2_17885 [Ilumatobacteraceae bacterium]